MTDFFSRIKSIRTAEDLKTAVIICGAARTWHFCKDYIVQFVNDIYGPNCDWFVAMYKGFTVSKEEIISYFKEKNQNLIFCETYNLIDITPASPLTWANNINNGMCYMHYQLSHQRRVHEYKTGKIYDRIFFSRPDTIYLYNDDTKRKENYFKNQENFAFQLRGDYADIAYSFFSPSANDIRTIAGKFSGDLLANRYLFFNRLGKIDKTISKMGIRQWTDAHSALSVYCHKHWLTVDDRYTVDVHSICTFVSDIIRPTHLIYNRERIKELIQNYNNFDMKNLYDNWLPGSCKFFEHPTMNRVYKLKSCLDLGIDPRDYGFRDEEIKFVWEQMLESTKIDPVLEDHLNRAVFQKNNCEEDSYLKKLKDIKF